MRLFSVFFWGVFLLASGIIILASLFFKLQVQTGKLIFGLFILLVGISLLTANFGWDNFHFQSGNTVSFASDERVDAADGNEYFVVFGSSKYDLSDLEPGARVKINCAFGSCSVQLPAGNVKVLANSAFGTVHMPDGSVSFGNRQYGTDSADQVVVELNCAFGSATVYR